MMLPLVPNIFQPFGIKSSNPAKIASANAKGTCKIDKPKPLKAAIKTFSIKIPEAQLPKASSHQEFRQLICGRRKERESAPIGYLPTNLFHLEFVVKLSVAVISILETAQKRAAKLAHKNQEKILLKWSYLRRQPKHVENAISRVVELADLRQLPKLLL